MKKEEMRTLRQDIAVSICMTNPSAFEKATAKKPVIFKDEREKVQVESLKNLMKLEPTIHHVLETYYRKDQTITTSI